MNQPRDPDPERPVEPATGSTVTVAGTHLEYRLTRGRTHEPTPPLVFLHEGLGSVSRWRTFPEDLRDRAAAPLALTYSRLGYGHSDPPTPEPWPESYMHDEALTVLPAVLEKFDIRRPVLVGHSDGASIALIHAATGDRVAGLVLLAPHVFVEDCTVAGIASLSDAYANSDLAEKLARHHRDADATFRRWRDRWLDSGFRRWSIETLLPDVHCPVLVVQGTEDSYGTLAQVRSVQRGVGGPVETLILDGGGHAPHQEEVEAKVIERAARFVRSCAGQPFDHHGGDRRRLSLVDRHRRLGSEP